jgi:hypothetical protein
MIYFESTISVPMTELLCFTGVVAMLRWLKLMASILAAWHRSKRCGQTLRSMLRKKLASRPRRGGIPLAAPWLHQ